ncbi:small membrane protein YohP [Paracoccus rhizosphaerae]|uniref:Aa3 type cytochrome c oxidase subunit IV n=1 Tax=Paracoccus rhizosphaerae TaxID=1133347 RepID=A0ABV6CI55_9RHOB|nr:hypothetical protein [Paracoccus rhizosphaerae]
MPRQAAALRAIAAVQQKAAGSAGATLQPEPSCQPGVGLEAGSKEHSMLKFLGGAVGIIFIIGLLVVIGLLALIF